MRARIYHARAELRARKKEPLMFRYCNDTETYVTISLIYKKSVVVYILLTKSGQFSTNYLRILKKSITFAVG